MGLQTSGSLNIDASPNDSTFRGTGELAYRRQVRTIGSTLKASSAEEVSAKLGQHSFVPRSYEHFHKQKQNTSTNGERLS